MKIGEKIILEPVNSVENQGTIDKCVAMSICEFMENEVFQLTGEKVDLSYDFIYANRKPTDTQSQTLDAMQGLRNVSDSGVCLESEFRVDNVSYPAILTHFKRIPSDVLQRAKKYALKFDTKILTGFDTIDQVEAILRSKHMLLTIVGIMGHAMTLRGIERVSEENYKYIFRNSWGGNGTYEIVGNKHFIYNNTTYYPKLINSESIKTVVAQPVVKPVVATPTVTPDVKPKLWRVQCGAFSKKENAIALEKKLKEQGFQTYIVQY